MTGQRLPSVAVVIPCFNGERYIGETLGSVLAQDHVDLHVVVVDDGSTDASGAIVAGIARTEHRVQLVQQANSGVSEARNRGLGAVPVAARAVMFLDADDVLEPGALERLATALSAAPDAIAAVGPHTRIDEDGNRLRDATSGLGAHLIDDRGKVRWIDTLTELTWRNFLPGNAVFTPGQCLVRREAIRARPFDWRFTPAEDWELWLRLTYDGRMVTVPEPVLRYRDHSLGMSKRYALMRTKRRDILRSHRVAHPTHARLFDAAYWFVMYRSDRSLNLRWAREQLRRGEVAVGLRYLARAGKLCATELAARVAGRRAPWWQDGQERNAPPPLDGAWPPSLRATGSGQTDPRTDARPAHSRIDGGPS